MKPPPFLLGGALLFWGWQTGFPAIGAVLGIILEAARWLQVRWDFSDDDFARIWTFCTLLFLVVAIYAFTSDEGLADMRGIFQNPNFLLQRNVGAASARTAASLCRWVPMVFFLFIAAQTYSSREGVPLRTLSLILSVRWKKARRLGQPLLADHSVNVAYPYFGLCVLSASFHVSENASYFWGLSALCGWALWTRRSRRYHWAIWAAALGLAFGLAFAGQRGLARLQLYLGSLNPQWMSGFGHHRFDPTESRTELGKIGRLKTSGKIVIRLEPRQGQAPPLLREASYRVYKGTTWYSEFSEADFQKVTETNETTYILVPGKTNTSRVNIACYLAGGKALLPLPSGSGRLENLSAYILQKSSLGAVLDEGPGLVVFDALFGPGQTMDDAPWSKLDFEVPPKDLPAVKEVVSELHLKGQTASEAVATLKRFFEEKFNYSLWQPPISFRHTNETPITRFLLRSHRGHCEYFATAGTLLLREAGIPARYAVGWAVHESVGNKYVIRQRDAHAWCLVWNQETGRWRDCDFTPGSWVQEEAERASPFEFLSDWWSYVHFQFSKFRWGQTHMREYILWALVPILLLLLYQILFNNRRRRASSARRPLAEALLWPGRDSEFYQLERKLSARGLPREPGEPLADWLRRASRDPALAGFQSELQELLRLHYRYRFDPAGLSQGERERLRQQVSLCLAEVGSR